MDGRKSLSDRPLMYETILGRNIRHVYISI